MDVKAIITEQPEWQDKPVAIKALDGGLTNEIFWVKVENKEYVIRKFGKGSERFTSRRVEMECLGNFSRLGLAPGLFRADLAKGYIISEFAKGRSLTNQDLNDTVVQRQVAQTLAKLHNCTLKIQRQVDVLTLLEDTWQTCHRVCQPQITDDEFSSTLLRFRRMLEAANLLDEPHVPCHLDPVPANFIKLTPTHETLTLIDWEYAGMAPAAIDLVTLFEEVRLGDVFEQSFLEFYLDKRANTDSFIELMGKISAFRAFPNLYWGMWGWMQAASSKINSDFFNYGTERFRRGQFIIGLAPHKV